MTGRELYDFVSQQVSELTASIDQLGLTSVEQRDLTIFLRFRSMREGHEVVIRCTYLENGHHPVPRITFVNPSTLAYEGNCNWPADRSGALKGSNNPPFICIPGVYEYHYQYHAGVQPLKHNLSLTNTIADIMGCLAK